MKTRDRFPLGCCWMLIACAMLANAADTEFELMEEIQTVTSECMHEHKLTPDQLGQLRSPAMPDDPAASDMFKPSENLQCFAQCILEKSRLIVHPDGVQDERLVRVGVLHGKDERTMRSKLRTCRSIYKAELTCAAAWDLYVCLTQ